MVRELQHYAKVMMSNFTEIRHNSRISRGNIGKISVDLLSAKFRPMRGNGTKIRLKTKVQYCSSPFDELLIGGRRKEVRPKA